MFNDAVISSYYAILNISVTMYNLRHPQVAFCLTKDAPFTKRIGCSVGMGAVGKREIYFATEDRTLAVETVLWSHDWPTLPDFTIVFS